MDYMLQWVNGDTKEIMREQVFGDMNKILDKIKYFEEIERNRDKNFSTIVLLDSSGVVWDAKFLDFFLHKMNIEDSWIIYRAIFKVEIRVKENKFNLTI